MNTFSPVSRRRFLGTLLAGAGVGAFGWLGVSHSRQTVHKVQWMNFGTLVEVAVADPDEQKVNHALGQLATLFQQQNDDWHPWKAGKMYDINRAIAEGRSIAVDQDMVAMIEQVQQLYQLSSGSFNPAIGHLVSQWGFHGEQSSAWKKPCHSSLDRMLADAPTPADLNIENQLLSSSNSAVRLDLGGYAKGYAIDRGLELLQAHQLHNVMINAGGDLVTSGAQFDRPWMIGIRHPLRDGAIAWLETNGQEAVFTSGTYERFHQQNGQRFAHIINPRNGQPAVELTSVTVVHSNSAIADAAATAILAEGKQHWQDIAEAMGMHQVMVVDRNGKIAMTDPMKNRIHLI